MIRLIKNFGKTAVLLLAVVAVTFALADLKQVAGKDAKVTLSTQQIRQAAQKGLAILEVTNKDWIQTGYCYSCHHDTLLIRTSTIARERGLPVNERLAFESIKKANQYLGTFDEAVQGTYFVDPTLVDGPKLTTAKHAGFAPNLTLAAYARAWVLHHESVAATRFPVYRNCQTANPRRSVQHLQPREFPNAGHC
ncbi:MAG TPA: hypothetical protein VGB07_36685, partial [Blastocatellia bacterium]